MFRVFILVVFAIICAPFTAMAEGGGPFGIFLSEITRLKENPQGRIIASGTMRIKEGKYSGLSEFVIETGCGGYRVKSGKNELLNDGEFNYIVDNSSREVTITFFDSGSRSVLANPLALLFELPEGFDIVKEEVSEGGYEVSLVPVTKDTGLSFLNLTIAPDGKSLSALGFEVLYDSSKTTVSIDIDSFSFSGSAPGSEDFTPDLVSLEEDGYFINDLR